MMPDAPSHTDTAIAALWPLVGAKARVVLSGTITEVHASEAGALGTIRIDDEAVRGVLGVGTVRVPLRFMKVDEPAPAPEQAGE